MHMLSAMRKLQEDVGWEGEREGIVWGGVVKDGHTDERTLSQDMKTMSESIWRESVLYQGDSKDKGPEVGMSLGRKAHQGANIVRAGLAF